MGSNRKVTGQQQRTVSSTPTWETPRKKHTGRIVFKVSWVPSCSVQQLPTCCKRVQCNKHLTLSKYAYVNFLDIMKYVNLDMNIRCVPLAPNRLKAELYQGFHTLPCCYLRFLGCISPDFMENWLYLVLRELQKNSLRICTVHFYPIHMMTCVLFEAWRFMTAAQF